MRLRIVLAMFIMGILFGAIAGYGVVQLYIGRNLIWIVTVLPWLFLLIFYGYKIFLIKKKINEIEGNFKEKFGFEINDKEPYNKYLDSLIGNKNNRI